MTPENGPSIGEIPAFIDRDPSCYAPGLRVIRKRRWYLWGVILVYMPVMWFTLEMTGSVGSTAPVFAVWFVSLCIAAGVSAAARCPECGNYFHMHGMTLLYLRKCLHCGLHVNADKKRRKKQ